MPIEYLAIALVEGAGAEVGVGVDLGARRRRARLRRHVLVVGPTLQADLLGVRVARAVAVLEERELLLVEVAGGGLDGVRHGEICEATREFRSAASAEQKKKERENARREGEAHTVTHEPAPPQAPPRSAAAPSRRLRPPTALRRYMPKFATPNTQTRGRPKSVSDIAKRFSPDQPQHLRNACHSASSTPKMAPIIEPREASNTVFGAASTVVLEAIRRASRSTGRR